LLLDSKLEFQKQEREIKGRYIDFFASFGDDQIGG